ncbi:MAG: hypothetical protein C7B46_18955 [Sulfobacillus benefaciens]|uniref:SnoaL-like domain-containing protein n=1 Tax=Sulfobacillus benefaciens TaxID=453960 RepID=A0A2T2X2M9_9FIRM|nr:MAG: hypothetical protein C7B46_18955 [Sulfobacillus benefaciens]
MNTVRRITVKQAWAFGGSGLLVVAGLVGFHAISVREAAEHQFTSIALEVLREEALIGSPAHLKAVPRLLEQRLVPGSQAALWTQWIWSQAHPHPALRYQVRSILFSPSGISATMNSSTESTVSLDFVITRTLIPKGQSRITGAATVFLSRDQGSWRVYGLTYNYSPQATTTPPSAAFQWDLWHLNPIPPLPQGT